MESADSENVKVIEWEDMQQELARLCSLSSALKDAEEKKSSLKEKLSSLIQVGFNRNGYFSWWKYAYLCFRKNWRKT